MATIKDVAKRTGLSLATISKYLNGGHVLDENRVAIADAIRELSAYPAWKEFDELVGKTFG